MKQIRKWRKDMQKHSKMVINTVRAKDTNIKNLNYKKNNGVGGQAINKRFNCSRPIALVAESKVKEQLQDNQHEQLDKHVQT